MFAYMYVMYICMYVCIYTCIYIYICIHVYVHVCVFACICLHMQICMQQHAYLCLCMSLYLVVCLGLSQILFPIAFDIVLQGRELGLPRGQSSPSRSTDVRCPSQGSEPPGWFGTSARKTRRRVTFPNILQDTLTRMYRQRL